jgi:hypothetical protein
LFGVRSITPPKATKYFNLAEQVLADIVANGKLNTPSDLHLA